MVKIIGQNWKLMTDKAKEKYLKMSEEDKKRFDKETEQMTKLGYFINKDGVKSTSILPELKNFPADTVMPIKSRSAFMFFNKANNEQMRKANPTLKLVEIMRKLAEVWNGMTEPQKKPFEDMAAKDKLRHENEIHQLRSKGFFINSDGQKSTDLKKKKTREQIQQAAEEKKKEAEKQKLASASLKQAEATQNAK
jgi:hypothetical protein